MSKFEQLMTDLETIASDSDRSYLGDAFESLDKAIDILHMISQWADAYPPDIFIPMTTEDWKDHHEILKLSKRSGSAAAADCMRFVVTKMKSTIERMS